MNYGSRDIQRIVVDGTGTDPRHGSLVPQLALIQDDWAEAIQEDGEA